MVKYKIGYDYDCDGWKILLWRYKYSIFSCLSKSGIRIIKSQFGVKTKDELYKVVADFKLNKEKYIEEFEIREKEIKEERKELDIPI